MKRQDLVGYSSGFMTGVFWAISGVFGQFLFEQRGIVPAWLVPIRLLSSGVLLFSYLLLTEKRGELLRLPRNRRDFLHVIAAGVFGTMPAQAAFFYAVKASNAATATVLQYVAPVFILLYVCIRKDAVPRRWSCSLLRWQWVVCFSLRPMVTYIRWSYPRRDCFGALPMLAA